MRNSRIVACVASLMGLVAANAMAGVNAWTTHGPANGGGATGPLAVHPTNGSIVLTGTNRGLFRSTNGGTNWTMVKNDMSNMPSAIAFDPSNPNRAVATDGWFYISEDAGQTFTLAQGPTAFNQVNRLAFGTNGTLYASVNNGRLFRTAAPFSTWTEITNLPWPSGTSYIQMLVVDPTDQQIFYVGVESQTSGGPQGLYRTANGGQNWTGPLNSGLVTPTTYIHLAFDPQDHSRLLLATGGGLFLSTNGGGTWSQRDTLPIYWVGFDPNNPDLVAALRQYEITRSNDDGLSWTIGADLISSYASGASYVQGTSGKLFVSTNRGIAISTNGGATAAYSLTGLTGVMPREVVASNDGTGAVLSAMASGLADVFRRNGAAWDPLHPTALQGVLPSGRYISSIAVAPGNSQQIFLVNSGSQLVRSFDGGANWTAPHPAFTANPGDYIIDVQIDPNNSQVAYVGRVQTGLWRTANGGTTFARLANSPTYINGIGVSPHNGMTLYVGGAMSSPGNGVWKSTDGGVSWADQMPNSQVGNSIQHFAFHPTEPDTVYGSSWDGVWRTTNGGGTWTRLVFPQVAGSTNPIASAVLFDPLFPSTLTVVGAVNGPGFMRSVDGGATWEATLLNLPGTATQFTSGVLDPVNPATVIAAPTSADMAEYQVSPNLELTVTALALPLPVSSNASMTYTITNRGPHASSASQIDINFPAWLTPSVPANCAQTGTLLRCQLGALRVDQSVSVPLTLAVGATPVDLQAQVDSTLTGHEPDVAMADNSLSTGVYSAEIADVDVAFSGGLPAIDRTQSTTVTATVSNAGPSPSTSTVLILQIPAILTVSNIVANGTCTTAADTITCNLGTIPSNATTNVTFTATGSAVGNNIVAATVQRAGIDPDQSHGATRDFSVRAIADLGITLADSADPVTAGNAFQYTATINNAGPDGGAVSSTITVAGANVTSATVSGGTCTNTAAAAVCNFTSLASGASAAITVNVTAGAAGTASATATVQFGGTDSVSTNNSSTANTTLSAPPSPPNNGGGGGGGGSGGGRFDWLLAALLGLIAIRRVRLTLARPANGAPE
jgi:photosystem II stability/assembly factor-like uncharacterized protein